MITGTRIKEQVLEAKTLKSGTPVVLGVMSMAELNGKYRIPYREFKSQEGYQRRPNMARVRKLANELRKNDVDLPTTVLLNIRGEDFDPATSIVTENGQKFLQTFGPFYVVDGQHRIEAIRELIDEDPGKWGDFKISFVCMLGADPEEELDQFYVVNSNSKSVPTDLALDLLSHRARTSPNTRTGLIESNLLWKVKAQELTAELNEHSEIWRGRIRFAGQLPEEKGASVITNTGMVTSLKPLFSLDQFSDQHVAVQVKVIDAFWKGVRDVLPEAFEDVTDYGIQKQTGAVVLHNVLVRVIGLINASGKSLLSPDDYASFIKDALLRLEDLNGEQEMVQGSEFWRAGSEGAAGSYSSAGGQRVLANKIKSELETPEIR